MRDHITNLANAFDEQGEVRIKWWRDQLAALSNKVLHQEVKPAPQSATGYWLNELGEVFLLASQILEEAGRHIPD